MKFGTLILFSVLSVSAGYAGYVTRAVSEGGNWINQTQYFVRRSSFSEVEATREWLSALAAKYTEEVVGKLVATKSKPAITLGETCGGTQSALDEAICQIRQGILEFNDSEDSLRLTQTLLWLLSDARRDDEWLTTYIQTVYRHPTHIIAGNNVTRALEVARRIGREDELETVLAQVIRIPFEFACKSKILEELGRSGHASAGGMGVRFRSSRLPEPTIPVHVHDDL